MPGEPDWEKWRRMEVLTLREGAALLTRWEPDEVDVMDDGFEVAITESDEEFRQFFRIRSVAISSIAGDSLDPVSLSLSSPWETRVKMSEFLRWAASKAFPIPSELTTPIVRSHSSWEEPGPLEVDWGLWSQMDTARLCDLVALSVGINPEKLCIRSQPGGGWGAVAVELPKGTSKEGANAYHRTMKLAGASLRGGLLPHSGVANPEFPGGTHIRLSAFVAWATSKGVVVPQQLATGSHVRPASLPEAAVAASTTDDEIVGKKKIAEYLGEKLGRTPPDPRTLDRWLEEAGVPKSRTRRGGHVVVKRSDLDRVRPASSR